MIQGLGFGLGSYLWTLGVGRWRQLVLVMALKVPCFTEASKFTRWSASLSAFFFARNQVQGFHGVRLDTLPSEVGGNETFALRRVNVSTIQRDSSLIELRVTARSGYPAISFVTGNWQLGRGGGGERERERERVPDTPHTLVTGKRAGYRRSAGAPRKGPRG